MEMLTQEGAFDSTLRRQINNNFQQLYGAILGFTGTTYYLDTVNGSDSNDGSLNGPFRSLLHGYNALRSGYNDVLVIISDGTTASSVRIASSFTWAKNAAHLVGVSSGVTISPRARIAPPTGATAFATFFTVSGSGCYFGGIQFFHGFMAGVAASICMTVTGGRNRFDGCHFAGMASTDHVDADSATSRNLKITTDGENQFNSCTVGVDTIARGQANASVEFAGGAPRNVFRNCYFPFDCSQTTPLGVIVSAAAGSDRFQLFDSCSFINAIKSGSSTMAGLTTLAASMGGMLVFKECILVGISEFGTNATSTGQIYIVGSAVDAATSGIAVNPT